MMNPRNKLVQKSRFRRGALLSLVFMLGVTLNAGADEADARRLLKAMSDYVAAQQALSFEYDSTLEIVTTDNQKIALASSGLVTLNRPGSLNVTRMGGFANVEVLFDGKTLTVLGKNLNKYAQRDIPGDLNNLIDTLHNKYNRPLPAADLLLENSYVLLMEGVIDIKDLGSGVIGGVECDHLAFRNADVDWQIWIAQGEHPYPCRYTVTTIDIEGEPQYTIQARNWKTGREVGKADFRFNNPTGATRVDLDKLDENKLPGIFVMGEAQ